MRNYQDAKDQIRRRIDLVDLVSEHVSLKRAGRNLKGLCPFHKEKTPSFNVMPDRQIFKCFGCGAGGDLFTFVQLIQHVEFSEAVRVLADRAGVELNPARKDRSAAPGAPAIQGRAEIARANQWAATWFRRQLLGEQGARARAYLAGRNIAAELADRFEIGLTAAQGQLLDAARREGLSIPLLLAADLVRPSDSGQGHYESFRDRLMFPIRDGSNRCIGFGGRALADSPAKYLNTARTELFDKSRCLFGLPLARPEIQQRGCAIVVEGYTDCIACHQHGFTNTVATLGTAATEEHMRILRRYVDTVILLFDSDTAGEAAAERALAVALQQNLTVRIAQVPQGKDPAEFLQTTGPKEFTGLLNSAVDALGFMWNRTLARFQNPQGGSSRRESVAEFVNLVGDLGRFGAVDAIQRGMIIRQVAELLALPAEEVTGLFARRPARPRQGVAASAGPRPDRAAEEPLEHSEQSTLVNVLEVLLTAPNLLSTASDAFSPARFRHPAYRHIAERFLDTAARPGDFNLLELLSALESPDEARLVTDMVFRGEQRGNHAGNLAALLERLDVLAKVRRSREAAERVKRHPADQAETGSEQDQQENPYLAAVMAGCSLHPFAGQAYRGRIPAGKQA